MKIEQFYSFCLFFGTVIFSTKELFLLVSFLKNCYFPPTYFCAKRFFHPWDKKIWCPSVRSFVLRKIITFCELNLGGGTHAAGPWWFELWILEGRKRTLHLFALATGISRFRDPFLDTVSGTFLQEVSKKFTLHIRPGTAPREEFSSMWRNLA